MFDFSLFIQPTQSQIVRALDAQEVGDTPLMFHNFNLPLVCDQCDSKDEHSFLLPFDRVLLHCPTCDAVLDTVMEPASYPYHYIKFKTCPRQYQTGMNEIPDDAGRIAYLTDQWNHDFPEYYLDAPVKKSTYYEVTDEDVDPLKKLFITQDYVDMKIDDTIWVDTDEYTKSDLSELDWITNLNQSLDKPE